MQNSVTRYIADATAFYAGIIFKNVIVFTTPTVIEEVRHIKKDYDIIDALIDTNMINIVEPTTEYIDKSKILAETSGDIDKLSDADLSLIALALELKHEVITDDYAVINVLKRNNIRVKSISSKMRKVGRWIKYCTGCKVSYMKGSICNRCGNKLSRKLVKH